MQTISKEATLREVLAEVSLVDLGGQIKTVLASMGCWGLLVLIGVGIDAGVSIGAPNLAIPNVVWQGILVFFLVMSVTERTSYHEWRFEFYFPKLGFLGWVVLTAYIVGVWQAIELLSDIQETATRSVAISVIWLVLLLPFFLFIGVLEIGHKRLIEKRFEAANVTQ